MKIGELAEHLGVSRSIIRYYEVHGLLPRVHRDAAGRRCYGEADLERLELVTGARQLGISCHDIREILAIQAADKTPPVRYIELLRKKSLEAEKRIDRLKNTKLELRQMHDRALTLARADKS